MTWLEGTNILGAGANISIILGTTENLLRSPRL